MDMARTRNSDKPKPVLVWPEIGLPEPAESQKKKKRWGAYPLSMTRAATSSVDEARHVSRCFERGRMDECGWWSSTRGGRYEIGPREGGQTDRQTYPPF
jgi:hypothetical protein